MMEKCPHCDGTGKEKGTTFVGEIPDCYWCKGTGHINSNQIYMWR
jgi:DnaJ-class molecular chaperone